MAHLLIQHLESCANLMLAPPECVSYEERSRAQQVFLDFQKTKCPFDLCREILETSSVSFVQFQAGCCLKNGVIRDWNSLTSEQRKLLLSYLNDYVNNRNIEVFVREELLLVCAIILKRIAIDEGNDSPTLAQILSYLFEMVSNSLSPINLRLVCCSSILSLLNEYSSSTRASDYGLPWATHLRAKKKFENTHLKSIFRCIVTSLINHLRASDAASSTSEEWMNLAAKFLLICDFILSWNFDIITIFSSQYAKHVDSIENPVLQPAIDWKEVLLDGDVIPIFFEVHLRVLAFNDEKLVHHSMQCLNQLSSLNGPIVINAESRLKFMNTIINGIIELIKIREAVSINEVVPVTSMINRICVRLQCRDQIHCIQPELLKSYFEIMTQLSCKLLVDSLRFEDNEEFDKYKIANDNMFNSWMVIITTLERSSRRDEVDSNSGRNHDSIKLESLCVYTRPVFEAFLRIHLNQPEGLRRQQHTDSDDIFEFEEDDFVLFYDQLNAAGCIARIDANHSINCLIQILSLRVNQLQMCLQREGHSQEKMIEWTNLNEDLHWLIMIVSCVLTQTNYGERELIPPQIMTVSIDTQADLSQTVAALQNCDPMTTNAIDPIVRTILILFKLCCIEKYLCETGLTQWVSPQVSLSLTMFMNRFSSTYLLPNESDYNEMSITLNSCFGRDSPYANTTLNFVVDHIITKLLCWSSEAKVTEESSMTLVHFVKNCPERCKALNNCNNMNKLLAKHANHELQNMSMTTRKNIYQIFVYVATYKQELYTQLFAPLLERYRQIQNSIEANVLNDPLRAAVIELCESLEGVASGTTAINVSSVWPNFIAPVFHDLPKLLQVFHNYSSVVIAILNLLAQFANRILCYISDQDVISFYNTSIAILNEYTRHNSGTLSQEESKDEEAYNDILVILNFLNDLAAKDFIEWYPDVPTETEATSLNATQVVFVGLNIIMPLMNTQLLEFPKLCQSYYKLIVFLCEDPDRLQGLPDQLMESIMQSVQLALKSTFGNDIKSSCLTMISVLGGHTMREPNKFQTIVRLLEPFLNLIFEFTLMECGTSNDVTMRESVANALFSLICCFPSRYQELEQQIISQQKSQEIQQQLRSTFAKLMEGLSLEATRVHRATFKRRFETFVIEIQGLLCIK